MLEFDAARFSMLLQMLAMAHSSVSMRSMAPSLIAPEAKSILGRVSGAARHLAKSQEVTDTLTKRNIEVSRKGVLDVLTVLSDECKAMRLTVSLPAVERAKAELEKSSPDEFPLTTSDIENIWLRVYDELNKVRFFRMPETAIGFCDLDEAKWSIINKLPQISEDVDEAGKCFAFGRYTACVFHLMRVMELSLRTMGAILNATIREKDGWLTILQKRFEPAINALPEISDSERKRKQAFQQARAHLHAVRLAWRNDTMHPKATYTEDEARELIEHVRSFTNHLAKLLP